MRAFLSLGQGEPLPRSGIARETSLLSCASCLSSRTNSRALGQIFQILKEEPDRPTAEEKVRDILSEFESTSSELSDETVKGLTDAYMKVLFSPWFRSFLTYNPQLALGRVVCPVLAINGEKDLQVDPKQNLPLIEAALRETGNKDSTIKELPGLNHLFQHCQTGLPAEYAKIDETFAPEALELIASWISGRTKSAMLPLEKP